MYNYSEVKPKVFTEDGQKVFLAIRDNVHNLLDLAGAVRMTEAIRGSLGSSWTMLACVDRLVELDEIRELTDDSVTQLHRVFVINLQQ